MSLKIQADDQESLSEINVTPLVDVMLVLVIILLVTAPLLTQSVRINLPQTVKTISHIKNQVFQLSIDAQQRITLNEISYASLADLEIKLKESLLNNPEMVVYLSADQNVIYGKVAEVMAVVQHVGINKLAFVTRE